MRILLVSHDFLPLHPSGTEIYTWQLGTALKDRGHDVHVFTTEKDVGRPNLRVDLREYGGLPVHELVNNLFYNDFRETWDYPPAARSFGVFLDDFKPDLVHFMHLMYLSVGCVEEAAKRGIPIVYTLHDYWLQCPRFGQRVHRDDSICHDITFDRCGDCMSTFKFRQTRTERATAKLLARVHAGTGVDLAPAVRKTVNLLRSRNPEPATVANDPASTEAAEAMRLAVTERDAELRRRLLPLVYRFLAPSRFLRESFLEWGIPPEQIHHSRAGIDTDPFRGFERTRADRLRVAFIGTLAPHKGAHVLLEAWAKLPGDLRSGADLQIFGPKTYYPEYVRQLERLAEECGIGLAGVLGRDEVVKALAEVDCLVVPSTWYENSPLIILEALATRTPLVVSDLGGMAELVDPGKSGFHFKVGDSDDLARVLERILRTPTLLNDLYPADLEIKAIQWDAEELEHLYERARQAVSAR